jgi:hypothetical protein
MIDKGKQQNTLYTKFVCKVDGDDENYTEQVYRFRQISARRGRLQASEKDYKGPLYNIPVD